MGKSNLKYSIPFYSHTVNHIYMESLNEPKWNENKIPIKLKRRSNTWKWAYSNGIFYIFHAHIFNTRVPNHMRLSWHIHSVRVLVAMVYSHDHGKTSDRKNLLETNLISTTDAKIVDCMAKNEKANEWFGQHRQDMDFF